MLRFVRSAAVLAALSASVPFAEAADAKSIDQAVDKGKEYLKARYKGGQTDAGPYGIGPAALAGVALLEARVPADDPAIKTITAAVRETAYGEHRTYQIALCIIFLDKLEDPADIPLIQVLALRLVAGQTSQGGWGYPAIEKVSDDHVKWLKANLKPEPKDAPKPATPKLHPDAATYAQSIVKSGIPVDDNSNTQFAILGLWLSRKHGVPVEGALNLIENRFRGLQDRGGGWGYMGPNPNVPGAPPGASTASMTCCGLLGLATGNARRIEKVKPKEPMAKAPGAKGDPFFTGPAKADKTEKGAATTDPAALKALAALGAAFAANVRAGTVLAPNEFQHGDRDYYLLWSIERVGVIYNLDKLGGVDWYEAGAEPLVKAQLGNGSWPGTAYGSEVNTSFALLFLLKADLLRDLSNKFRNSNTEMRAGNSTPVPSGNGTDTAPMPKNGNTVPGTPALPTPVEDASTKLASQLVLTPATDWTKALEKLRDAKGAENTRGLVIAIRRLDGDRKKEAREALAERLTRMSAETLKGQMTAEDAELRRGAVLAAAMKDDKTHVPDLIARLLDEDDVVVRAAKAGLKSLTSQDFGPKAGATKDECKVAAAAWKAWWDKNKP